MRKLLSHAFSDRALREQEPLLQIHVDELLAKLREQAAGEETVDIKRWVRFAAFDMIGDFSFGRSFDCLPHGRFAPFVENIAHSFKNIALFSVCFRFPVLATFLRLLVPSMAQDARVRHATFVRERVHQRMVDPTPEQKERKDFLSYILRHNDERGMAEDEIEQNAAVLIGAGSDTTAAVVYGTMYLLLANRKIYSRLAKEIRTAFTFKEDICIQGILDKLPYLQAVIDESLRVYPPALIGQIRIVPEKGRDLCGEWIPGGTTVLVNQYAAFRDPRNFGRADEFLPERWMGGEEWAWEHREVVQAFSVGARNCIGKK